MKLITLVALLILSSQYVVAQVHVYVPENRRAIEQQMQFGQRMLQQNYIRNEQIMNTQEAIRYGLPLDNRGFDALNKSK